MIPQAVHNWLAENGCGEVVDTSEAHGGCINHGATLKCDTGLSYFLKTSHRAPQEMFPREAEGLHALQGGNGPRIPDVFLVGADFILLEDLDPAPRSRTYWPDFGRQMAALHCCTAGKFGFSQDNFIGSTLQPNQVMVDGYEFYARQRYGFQAGLARGKGLLSESDFKRAERLSARLPELIPEQSASLLHGDLWSGNQLADQDGNPAIIDPAVYYGWAEADLAMMTLFGHPGPGFFESYQEVRPLAPGWQERFELYNLYHLLNHLTLFGGGYHAQTVGILRKYA